MASVSALRKTSLVSSNILLVVALLVFAKGFFPYKPFLPGLASFEDAQQELELVFGESYKPPKRVFDKVVFMVVDALRRWV